jgi:alpha-tubulin suppressor-like RCC1 family protein
MTPRKNSSALIWLSHIPQFKLVGLLSFGLLSFACGSNQPSETSPTPANSHGTGGNGGTSQVSMSGSSGASGDSGSGGTAGTSGTGNNDPQCAGIFEKSDCTTCGETKCCAELANCQADSTCMQCLSDNPPTNCEQNSVFNAISTCVTNACKTQCSPTLVCNPVTNEGCNITAGEACDLGNDNNYACFPAPNDANTCGACSNASGPFCKPSNHCLANKCTPFCKNDNDCKGFGVCDTALAYQGFGLCVAATGQGNAAKPTCNGGAGGSSGAGGAGGSAGSAGTGGSGGSAGTAGTAGISGSAGTSGTSGSAGTAGAGGSVEMGNISTISAGVGHSCAVLSDSTVVCWGDNSFGQLGNGTIAANQLKPVPAVGLGNVLDVSVGWIHSCALLKNGTVRCWGDGLGSGSQSSTTPVPVSTLTNAISISSGDRHACALLDDSNVRCWGKNNNGQIGSGDLLDKTLPTSVLWGAKQVVAGRFHTCALLDVGTVFCWGSNTYGQLGTGNTTDSTIPTKVSNLDNVASITVGYYHTCAVRNDGTVFCWGSNSSSQIGTENSIALYALPTKVSTLSEITSISAGNKHTCAITQNDSLYCWGANGNGQLGIGNTDQKIGPTLVSTLPGVKSVDGGEWFTCAVTTSNYGYCWGFNYAGQLGTENTMDSTLPKPILSL